VAVAVKETFFANRQSTARGGPARRAYGRFLRDLGARGCAAMGYRVTGPEPPPYLCVCHLRGADRVVVAFSSPQLVWVVLLGQHTGNPATDIYDLRYAMAGVRPERQDRRRKPACCDPDGAAPDRGRVRGRPARRRGEAPGAVAQATRPAPKNSAHHTGAIRTTSPVVGACTIRPPPR
jgi:hypothetical protein